MRSYASTRAGPSFRPMSARSARRALKIASGSMSRPISRATSPSPGGVSASATKAGSSLASSRMAASAAISWSSLRGGIAGVQARHIVDQQPHRDGLQGLPAVEGIAVVRGEEGEIVAVKIGVELDRRRETAVDRQYRLLGDAGEVRHVCRRLVQHQHAVRRPFAFAGVSGRSRPSLPTRPSAQRDDHRFLARLARRRRHALLGLKRVGFARGVVTRGDRHFRRAGLVVPAHELRHVAARGVGEALDELLDGRGVAVVAREIEIHAGAEFFFADQRLHHAHHFGAFLVHGAGVEVIDFLIGFRPDRMRQGPCILDELRGAQAAHIAKCASPGASACRRKIPDRGKPSVLPSGKAGTSRGR